LTLVKQSGVGIEREFLGYGQWYLQGACSAFKTEVVGLDYAINVAMELAARMV